MWALTPGVGPLTPEEIVAIDAAGAMGPDLQVVQEDEDGWWRTAIWVQRKLLGMVLGVWVGKMVGPGIVVCGVFVHVSGSGSGMRS